MAEKNSGKQKIPLIGLLAVKNHLISKADLQAGLTTCSGSPDLPKALKEYFIANEMVSEKNITRLVRAAKALELRQKEFKFGATAIRKGFINQSVLKLVLEEQQSDMKAKKKVRMIGDMLMEAGMLTLKQKDYILKLQNRVRQENAKKAGSSNETGSSKEAPAAAPTGKDQKKDAAEKPGESPAVEKDEPDDEKEAPGLLEPEVITGGIKLQISGDFMAAFLSKTEYFDDNVTVTQIKESLFDKGVVLGVVSDEMIQGFIKSSGFKTKTFRVAKGVHPIEGKDARVEFFFNTDFLKAGGVTQDGSIDFKDRGDVPHVEEGTVLAEKVPMVDARNGHNIYGDEIPTTPGRDIPFKLGKGAKVSEDGIKVLAAVKGFPKYALSGHIFVHDVYVTEGDVDYETGHVQYDGNVDIKGRIKSGFKVNGNDVSVIELDGGVIHAEGDVSVAGGVNEGTIYARGNVYAKFVHKSQVICMGDVVVQKEIVDSNIENSGSCVVENGKLISSQVTSKMGVKAKNIGTEMAGPSTVKVGYDVFTEKELEKNKEKSDKIRTQINHLLKKKEGMTQENLDLQKQITELAHVQDRSQLEEKELKSKLAEHERGGSDPQAVKELQEKMVQLKESAANAEKDLDVCFDKSEEIEELLEKEAVNLEMLEKRMADCKEERDNLIKWSKDNPGKSMVVVEGAIMPETVIKGLHSETRVPEMIRHARVSEILCTSEDGQSLNIYEMQVGSI